MTNPPNPASSLFKTNDVFVRFIAKLMTRTFERIHSLDAAVGVERTEERDMRGVYMADSEASIISRNFIGSSSAASTYHRMA